EAVYLPVIGVANNRWLNTFLIRIPLTKFVKPLTVFLLLQLGLLLKIHQLQIQAHKQQLKVHNNKTKNMPQNVFLILRRVYT
ncbi:hypothetical protein WC226_03410, partial [Mycoplasmopsis synoviae]